MKNIINYVKNRRLLIVALLSYVVLALYITYPLILNMTTMFPSTGPQSDSTQYIWNLWWMKYAITHGSNPFYSDYIFYPHTVGLLYNAFMPLRGLISVPIQAVVGLIAAHNVLVIVSIVLLGVFTYLLAYNVTGNRRGAFLAGFYIILTPYLLDKIEWHQNLSEFHFLPLFLLSLLLLNSLPSKKHIVLFVFSLSALFLTDYYQFFYACFFCVIGYFFLPKTAGWRKSLFISVFCSYIVLFPFVIMFVLDYSTFRYDLLTESGQYSLDPARLVLPPARLWITQHVYQLKDMFWVGKPEEPFLGYIALFLVATQIRFLVRHTLFAFLAASLLVFFIFALGPYLNFVNRSYTDVPLPFSLLLHVPILQNLRIPLRFMIPILVLFSLFIALAYQKLEARFKHSNKYLLLILLCLLIGIEFRNTIFYLEYARVSPFYEERRLDQEDYVIWTVPTEYGYDETRAIYAQAVHGKRILGGFVSRLPLNLMDQQGAIPFVANFLSYQYQEGRNFSLSDRELNELKVSSDGVFEKYRIKFVVFYKRFGEHFGYLNNDKLEETFLRIYPLQPFYEDEQLTAYKTY